MGAYEVLPGGELRRHSLSYAEELRPLDRPEHPLVRLRLPVQYFWDRAEVIPQGRRSVDAGDGAQRGPVTGRRAGRRSGSPVRVPALALVAQAGSRRRCSRWRCSSRCCRCSSSSLLLLAFAGEGWIERRVRLGRHGRPVVLTPLPRAARRGVRARRWSASARASCRCCSRSLRGRLSFVGPRALPPGTGAGHTGPRRLMAPGLTGPAQRGCADGDRRRSSSTTPTSSSWSLWVDARMLAGRCPKPLTRACRRAARRPRPAAASSGGEQRAGA